MFHWRWIPSLIASLSRKGWLLDTQLFHRNSLVYWQAVAKLSESQHLPRTIKKNFTPFQLQQLPKFQQFLCEDLKFSASEFSTIVEKNGDVLNCHLSAVKSRIAYLQSAYLIKAHDFKRILLCHPKWLYRPKEDIDELCNCLVSNGISFSDLSTVLTRNPSVLLSSADKIDEIMEVFNDNFFTSKEKREILLKSTYVFDKRPEVLRKIYSYLKETFNMTHEEMMLSRVFSHTFRHLYCRLEFMKRRGLYIGRDKRRIFPSNKQPHPQKIIESADKFFVEQVALSNAEEFELFCKSLPPKTLKELKLYDNWELEPEEVEEDNDDRYTEEDSARSRSWNYLKSKYD